MKTWILRAEPKWQPQISSEKQSSARHPLSRWFLAELISSTLKMEAICSSETSVDTQRTTRHYIPQDGTLHNHRCENIKSYRAITFQPVISINTCIYMKIHQTFPWTQAVMHKINVKAHSLRELSVLSVCVGPLPRVLTCRVYCSLQLHT
jgi:hypothetical protein